MKTCEQCGNEIQNNLKICPHCGFTQSSVKKAAKSKSFQKINLKIDLPTVDEALQSARRKINTARSKGLGVLKLVHGYGSSGVGGRIRIELRKELLQMKTRHLVRNVIFGEDFTPAKCKQLLRRFPELEKDEDYQRRNKGITLVEL
ncbi:MAG: hypothetical protein JXQ65_08040 [Candidatus Marinimicrobia bacterium]|nr:hypothetical protein [Candidatus Neomarinimicrobiota bacterium]